MNANQNATRKRFAATRPCIAAAARMRGRVITERAQHRAAVKRQTCETAAAAPTYAAIVALVLASLLCLASCGPAQPSSVSVQNQSNRYEKAVELPTGISHVSDIAYADDGSLIMVASTSQSQGVTVYVETVEGFWKPLFDTQALLASLGEDSAVGASCLTPDGRLFCSVSAAESGAQTCYLVDPASFREVPLSAASIMNMRCFDNETVLVSDWTKTFARYDLSTGEKICEYRLPSTSTLADFIMHDGLVFATTSKPSGSSFASSYEVFDADSGEKANIDPSLESVLNGLFSSADLPDAPSPVWARNDGGLFVCAKNALYSCSGDAAAIIASGDNMNLSNTGKSPQRLVVGQSSDDIAVLYSARGGAGNPNTLYRYVEGEQPEPTSSLTVYTLENNTAIQQAVATYRDEHPEVALSVHVGASADSGVSADDALRALNADLLAGAGPDIIVLDGLPIDDFAEQGALLDLSDVLQTSLNSGDEYFENVLRAFSTEGDCYAIPTRFGVPAILGDVEMLEHATSLAELTTFVESSDEARSALSPSLSVPALYAASYQEMFGDAAGVNREALERFFSSVKTLVAIGNEHLTSSSDSAPEGYDYLGSQLNGIARDAHGIDGSSMLMLESQGDPIRLQIGTLLSDSNFAMASLSIENASFSCVLEPLNFNSEQVFVPSGILAVNAKSTEADAAKEFVSYLLSKQHQKQRGFDGIPVNKTAFAEQARELGGYGVSVMGDNATEEASWSRGPFTEEEIESNCRLAESATLCCAPDKTISDIVETELIAYCRGTATLDQAVAGTLQKIDLYLAQ